MAVRHPLARPLRRHRRGANVTTELERLHMSHEQKPTTKFAKFHESIVKEAERTVAERERRTTNEHDDTEYHKRAELTEGT